MKKLKEIINKLATPILVLATAINPIAGAIVGLATAVVTLDLKDAKEQTKTINNEVTIMLEGKKTYIGLAVAGLAMVAQMFGFEVTAADQGQLSDTILGFVNLAGLLFATYGRIKATKK